MRYFHNEIPELYSDFKGNRNVQVGVAQQPSLSTAMDIALLAMRIAMRVGIRPPSLSIADALAYTSGDDTLTFDAPLTSAVVHKKMIYLRGWQQFDSCVKGFNALGLMAEQVHYELGQFKTLPIKKINDLKLEFLASRLNQEGNKVFTPENLSQASEKELIKISLHDLAIWSCFYNKTIVCSTSSNMGISLHQALRLMQNTEVFFLDKKFHLLNNNEGALIIWCPDERADFMNAEKSALLRAIENEKPQITRLRTYINRQQRDPGALSDALTLGGYFFPTNPQSRDELQNLLYLTLKELTEVQGISLAKVAQDVKISRALKSLGCALQGDRLIVERGVEGGIYGLMLPYFILVEEFMAREMGRALSTWNQASIGAALAAAVMADDVLRDPTCMADATRAEFNAVFPSISKYIDTRKFGKNTMTQLHGVFDIANLQSLAQLLGVVVENHMTGRGTAFVGLGSSSYSNGNRCYEILKKSMDEEGSFRGKSAFHPATHTINPFAQALIFGEDLYRIIKKQGLNKPGANIDIKALAKILKKPEPAGAAALAGFLLARLDRNTLSAVEIAYALKLVGFDTESFLEFSGYEAKAQGLDSFLQNSSEEGTSMGGLALHMMVLLGWSLKDLEKRLHDEQRQSRIRYWKEPMDELDFEHADHKTCIYLTGDNTGQPSEKLLNQLVKACCAQFEKLREFTHEPTANGTVLQDEHPVGFAFRFVHRINKYSNSVHQQVERASKKIMDRLISKSLEG